MGVTFVAGDAGGGNIADIASATDPLTWPSGGSAPQSGDVAVIIWSTQNTVTPTTPTGWTVPTGGSADSTSGALRMRVMYHVCTGSESGTISLTNGSATINRQSAVLAVYRGVDTSTPIDAISSRAETAAGTTHASPSVTTVAADAVGVAGIGERVNSGTSNWTPPASPFNNERADSTTLATGSGGTTTAIADDGLAAGRSAGATVTPGSWTSANSISTANVLTWTLTLKPLAPTAKSVSDTSTASDALTLTAATTLTDTSTGTDAAALAAATPLTDTSTAGDAIAVNRPLTLTDPSGAVEVTEVTAAMTAAETAAGSDALTVTAGIAVSETATGTDAIAATAVVSLTEIGSAGDAIDVTAATGLTDTATGVDALTLGQPVNITDTADATDTAVAVATLTALPDTVTAADALSITADVFLADVVAAVDTLVAPQPTTSRGSMTGHLRTGPETGAAVRQGPDLYAGARGGPHTANRPRAGASMGGGR